MAAPAYHQLHCPGLSEPPASSSTTTDAAAFSAMIHTAFAADLALLQGATSDPRRLASLADSLQLGLLTYDAAAEPVTRQ